MRVQKRSDIKRELKTYQTRLFKDLAVNHIPCTLTQRQHPQEQHQIWTVLVVNTNRNISNLLLRIIFCATKKKGTFKSLTHLFFILISKSFQLFISI